MRIRPLLASMTLLLLIAASASAVTMAWTPIGNPGNACDPQPIYGQAPGGCFGTVDYTYNIGIYEVTNEQYTEFLNAKAASDPLGLYSEYMGNSIPGGITRSGTSGTYSYSAIPGSENMPVNWVSFYDAVRFANWMNNGQGNSDTETGAYTLLGGTATPSNLTVARNPGATIFLPSENEWYKAAYYDPSTTTYFDYASGSNAAPTCSMPTATPNHANCYGGQATTVVGSYTGSGSPFGTFDQGGNLEEWNESIHPAYADGRGSRGGSYADSSNQLSASARSYRDATQGQPVNGIRLVMIPEPSTGLLVIAGLLGLGVRRRRRE